LPRLDDVSRRSAHNPPVLPKPNFCSLARDYNDKAVKHRGSHGVFEQKIREVNYDAQSLSVASMPAKKQPCGICRHACVNPTVETTLAFSFCRFHVYSSPITIDIFLP
jgi:hypothetical protein